MGNECETMVMFRGRAGFNPNTINNQLFTFAIADWWREQNDLEKLKEVKHEKFTYKEWIRLLVDVHEFLVDWRNTKNVKVTLFDDWSIYGDGLFLTELQAIAVFNPKTDENIRILKEEERFLLTDKFGQNRAALSDHDTDIQIYSKLYGFNLFADEELKIKFKPTGTRNVNVRTPKPKDSGKVSCQQVEWIMIGSSEMTQKCKFEQGGKLKNKFLEHLLNTNIFLKFHMSRYNHESKMAIAMGFLQDAQYQINSVDFQGWRQVVMYKKNATQFEMLFYFHPIRFKKVKNGLLIDVSNAITDSNTELYLPKYPLQTVLEVEWNGQTQLRDSINIEKVLAESAGIMLYKNMADLPTDSPIEASMHFQFDESAFTQQLQYFGIEKKYVLNTDEVSQKIDVWEQVPVSLTSHKTQADFNIFCTSYGKPINQQIQIQLNTTFDPSSDAVDNYAFKSLDFFKNLFEERMEVDPEFQGKYKNFENIKDKVYHGILPKIIELSTQMGAKTKGRTWKNSRTGDPFDLRLLDQNGKRVKKKMVKFVDGKAKEKIVLDEDLIPQNNPRHPYTKSLAICGLMVVKEGQNVQSRKVQFCMKFFENEINTAKTDKIDWVHDIGPELRKFGLVYPVMQNILDLYNFKEMHLLSMKRCFDVEDENDPKYMPNTRQMSKILHRKIRRWLYRPLYNKDAILIPSWKMKQKHKAIQHRERLSTGLSLEPFNFDRAKEELVSKLKGIWHVEFFTIPVYLSCQFTAPNKATRDLIRGIVKDQMKHLFIVSNILNAIHDESLHPGRKVVPFDDHEIIPRYPSKPNYIFETKNPKLKSFLTFDILPCTPEQILKLICIQLPSQTKYLNFKYIGHPETGKMDPERARRAHNLSLFIHDLTTEHEKNPDFRTIADYYGEVMDMFWDLSDMEKFLNSKGENVRLFSGDPQQQFTYFGLENMSGIYDLRSTLNQLRLVVEEGEGGNLLTLDGGINKESHFLKFIQVYMMSSIEVKTRHENTKIVQILFQFQDADIQTVNDDGKLEKKWTPQMDKKVEKNIQIQVLIPRQTGNVVTEANYGKVDFPTYPSVYAKPAFENAYVKVLKELDVVFNTNFKVFSSTLPDNLSDEVKKKEFELFKRRKMEDSISRMKQMAIEAKSIIYPESYIEKFPDIGSRPNYNIDFKGKTSFEIDPKKK